MLNRNFYDNHIFFISKFDENMYINLNGKVLNASIHSITKNITKTNIIDGRLPENGGCKEGKA